MLEKISKQAKRAFICMAFKDFYVLDLDEDDGKEMMEEYFNMVLKGKSIKDANGKSYKVLACKCSFADLSENPFFSVNVFLDDYSSEDYFLYEDDVFEENLQKKFDILRLTYSESGMQGGDYVNLDVNIHAN